MVLRKLGVWLGAAAMAVTVVGCAETDPGITTAVKSKLAADDTVKAYRIDVDTAKGVVTLTGKVDTSAARGRAVELTRATDGVRDVVDQLTVSPGATPTTGVDDAAANKTGAAIRDADAKTDAAQNKGAGAARDADAKTDSAQRKAGSTADRAGDATGDAALTASVKTKLLADTDVAGLKINVDTKNNIVTLTGTVSTAAEKKKAVQIARGTEGVKSVVDNLKVGKQ